jgi:hypothetical protein
MRGSRMESATVPIAEKSTSSVAGSGGKGLKKDAIGFSDGLTGFLESVPSEGEAPDRRIRDGGDDGKRHSER